jgi:hypothetical protein
MLQAHRCPEYVAMDDRRCAACGRRFRPRPQNPDQRYCAAPACQAERRRRWQQAKRQHDPDYQDNQTRAQQAWAERHADYWRDYRRTHPDYTERNRAHQRGRNRRRRAAGIAKMDASTPDFAFQSGTYRLLPADVRGIAKMDAWTVQISVISEGYREPGG